VEKIIIYDSGIDFLKLEASDPVEPANPLLFRVITEHFPRLQKFPY
jgi:hypothetical protein